MKITFILLTFVASALCAPFNVPCGHSFVIKPHKVHAKASASACVSHKASFFFGCKESNPVIKPVVPVTPLPPVVREPQPPRLPEPPVVREPQLPRLPVPPVVREPEPPVVREPVVRDRDVREPIVRDPIINNPIPPPSSPVGPAEVVPVVRRGGGGGGIGRGNNRRLAMR